MGMEEGHQVRREKPGDIAPGKQPGVLENEGAIVKDKIKPKNRKIDRVGRQAQTCQPGKIRASPGRGGRGKGMAIMGIQRCSFRSGAVRHSLSLYCPLTAKPRHPTIRCPNTGVCKLYEMPVWLRRGLARFPWATPSGKGHNQSLGVLEARGLSL